MGARGEGELVERRRGEWQHLTEGGENNGRVHHSALRQKASGWAVSTGLRDPPLKQREKRQDN